MRGSPSFGSPLVDVIRKTPAHVFFADRLGGRCGGLRTASFM